MKTLSFQLSDAVIIKASGEVAEVLGRAEYSTAEPAYFLRYRSADGRAVEQWWGQSALRSAEKDGVTLTADSCSSIQATDAASAKLPPHLADSLKDQLRRAEEQLEHAENNLQHMQLDQQVSQRRIDSLRTQVAELRSVLGTAA